MPFEERWFAVGQFQYFSFSGCNPESFVIVINYKSTENFFETGYTTGRVGRKVSEW
jgi:hypothetical protein